MKKKFLHFVSRKPWYIRLGMLLLVAVLIVFVTKFFYDNQHITSNKLRYTSLPLFQPHRVSFTCIQQAAATPPSILRPICGLSKVWP